jgi:pimeloyl-ACP methyl ester carboxylesterase
MSRSRNHLFAAAGVMFWLLAAAMPAVAQPLVVTLNNVVYTDPTTGDTATLSGSFDFDPYALQISNTQLTLSVPSLGLSVPLQLQGYNLLAAPNSDQFIYQSQNCTGTNCVLGQASLNPGPAVVAGTYALGTGASAGFAIGQITSNGVATRFQGNTTSGSLTITWPGQTALYVVSPFLLGAGVLSDIDLDSVLTPNPGDLSAFVANGMASDNVSSVIALYVVAGFSDVTFETTNGTTLQDYDPMLLTHTPEPGPTSLTVPAASLVDIDGTLYAAAVLQPPFADTPALYSSPITVTASGPTGSQATASLQLVPPPVILIHGLWGSKNSLKSMLNYLQSNFPWNNGGVVIPIDYHQFGEGADDYALPFDDPTIVATLDTAIENALDQLNGAGTVAGRVDIVAHSMGGLVARHFASPGDRGDYVDTVEMRDHGAGKFHQIVTLDTPEEGSAFAAFLLQIANQRRQAPIASRAGAVWQALCGKLTVEACFAKMKHPLVGADGSLGSGAVYSLSPQNAGLFDSENMANQNVPGANWCAISAQIRPMGSALEYADNLIIRALYPAHAAVPTTSSILGTNQSDAIVTLASQTWEAIDGNSYTFDGLAHIDLGPALGGVMRLLALNFHLNYAGVTNSQAVDALAANWLISIGQGGGSSCANFPKVERPTEPQIAAAAPLDVRFLAPLVIEPPTGARLGEPFDFAVHIGAPLDLTRLYLDQSNDAGQQSETQQLQIVRAEDGLVHVRGTPMLPGAVTFTISAGFADGAIATGEAEAQVRPPATGPARLRADANFPQIRLRLRPDLDRYQLHPQAFYAAAPDVIDLPASAVHFHILPGGEAIVGLRTPAGDASGVELVARAPGTATIEAAYGSATDRLEVIVLPAGR